MVALCRVVMSHVVNVSVPLDRLDELVKAVEEAKARTPKEGGENVDFFVSQNPATKKLGSIVSETYDAMTNSLVKEIGKVLK